MAQGKEESRAPRPFAHLDKFSSGVIDEGYVIAIEGVLESEDQRQAAHCQEPRIVGYAAAQHAPSNCPEAQDYNSIPQGVTFPGSTSVSHTRIFLF